MAATASRRVFVRPQRGAERDAKHEWQTWTWCYAKHIFSKELNVRLFRFRWLPHSFYFGFFPTWVLQVQWLFLVLLHNLCCFDSLLIVVATGELIELTVQGWLMYWWIISVEFNRQPWDCRLNNPISWTDFFSLLIVFSVIFGWK